MSKRSTVTVREQPVAGVTSKTGSLTVRGESLTIATTQRTEVLDVTDRVMAMVRELGVQEGIATLSSMHTTCTVFINEHQRALLNDITRFLEVVVERDGEWMHNDPEHSDCDRQNADSHLRALLLGHSLTLQVSGGEAVLGQWQRILMAELDGPRPRTLRLQVMGVA
jgi:secondary thiamine-phosphate synthase enzyme